jgi:hypothetical protein
MAPHTFDEYLAAHGSADGGYPVIDLDAADMQRHTLIVTSAGGTKKAIVRFLGLAAHDDGEHLCIDVHAFIDGLAAHSSVFGMQNGRRIDGFPETAAGRSRRGPAVRGVSVLIGAQADTEALPDLQF